MTDPTVIADDILSFKYPLLTLYVQGDPSCDACILAREFLRLQAQLQRYEERIARATI